MENQKTLLSELRSRSAIDCDTLDVEGMPCIDLYTKVILYLSVRQSLRHWDLLLIVLQTRSVERSIRSRETLKLTSCRLGHCEHRAAEAKE